MQAAAQTNLAIIVPETARPYRAVFDAIVAGIERGAAPVSAHRFALSDDTLPVELSRWLDAVSPHRVIALGRLAYDTYTRLDARLPPPIVGALDATPETHPDVAGVGLSVAPALLFEVLRELRPDTGRVLVVYDPARDRRLIETARQAAADANLVLEAFPAQSLVESTGHFWKIFKYANPATDALWLPVDGGLVDEKANLPTIVSQGWARRFTVFSNNLEHVNRGVLFALYPDPEALGQRLADFALSTTPPQGIQLLEDVKRALNLRISRHLDVSLTGALRKRFDLILGGER